MAIYKGEGVVAGSSDLTPSRSMTKYVNWIKTEFQPLTMPTPDPTIEQCVENTIRYFNTHSGHKIHDVYDYNIGQKRVQLSTSFKNVIQVYPVESTTWIWNEHPLWTLVGVTIMDNVTTDLIMMSEAFRGYRSYVGTDFRWTFERSPDPSVGGYLYIKNIPHGNTAVYVLGIKRITANEDIQDEFVLDWILRYSKSLVKQVEGNTLRKAGIIDVKNDGSDLVREGTEEMKDLQRQLGYDGRWVALAVRA